MKTGFKLSLVAGLLAVASLAYSQGPRGMWNDGCDPAAAPYGMMDYGMPGMRQDRMGKMDPAKMQARRQAMQDQRHAALKTQLKLSAEQEAAWTAFIDSAKPGANKMAPMTRPDPAELAKLSTPERMDKMKALRDERMATMTAAMDKHMQATKTFYAVLTPEQQKMFDAFTLSGQSRTKGSRRGQGPAPAAAPAPAANS